MRSKIPAVLVWVAGLAACGGGSQDAVVRFSGLTPNAASQQTKDTRKVTTACPGCGKYKGDLERCDDKKKCDTRIKWDASYPCGFCHGTKACNACVMMEQKDGKCFYCKGEGVLPYKGAPSECRNCKAKKVCPVCAGSQKCDFCKGEGRLTKAQVQELAKASAATGDSSEKKEEPVKKEEPKKEEPKKEEPVKVEEPKKEEPKQ